MDGVIRYIKFSVDYDQFDERKDKKGNCKTQGYIEVLKKEWEIPIEEDEENNEDILKIYEGNSKVWDLLIISLTYIPFWLVRKRNEYAHEAWKSLIEKYEVSY